MKRWRCRRARAWRPCRSGPSARLRCTRARPGDLVERRVAHAGDAAGQRQEQQRSSETHAPSVAERHGAGNFYKTLRSATRADKAAAVAWGARRKSSWLIRFSSVFWARSSSRACCSRRRWRHAQRRRLRALSRRADRSRRARSRGARARGSSSLRSLRPSLAALAAPPGCGTRASSLRRRAVDVAGSLELNQRQRELFDEVRRQGQTATGGARAGGGAGHHRARAVRSRGAGVPRRQERAGRRPRAAALQLDRRAARQAALGGQRLKRPSGCVPGVLVEARPPTTGLAEALKGSPACR